MRAVIQRVSEASVVIGEQKVADINQGLLIFLGVEIEDAKEDALWLANKIVQLRIFQDEKGVMNKSIMDVDGKIIMVSQFTLHAKTKKGNRPSYIKASKSDFANKIYKEFLTSIENKINKKSFSGIFGADMLVKIENDGPVTIFIDSKNKE